MEWIKNLNIKKVGKYLAILVVGLAVGYLMRGTGGGNGPEGTHVHSDAAEYTCSMHPQIRQPAPGKCPLCGMDLIPVSVDTDNSAGGDFPMSKSAVQLANIVTSQVGYSETGNTLTLNGRIEADERRTFHQTSHMPGRIDRLYVQFEGDYVQRGQTIALVYSPELITAQKELIEASKLNNKSILEAARSKLRGWKLTEENIAAIEKDKVAVESFPIRADVSGFVKKKFVQLGDHVMSGKVLFEIEDLSKVWGVFEAYEGDLQWLKPGENIKVFVQALPDKSYTLPITWIDPSIDPVKRVARLRVDISNSDRALKPEMFITGSVATGGAGKALTVPKSAVIWTGKRSVVYVKSGSGDVPRFALREVSLAPVSDELYAVQEGLKEGEEVVTNGTFSVDAAAQLMGKKSMMNDGSEEAGNASEENVEGPVKQLDAPEEFKKALGTLVEEYLLLKDALVAGSTANSGQHARAMAEILEGMPKAGSLEATMSYWEKRSKTIGGTLKSIVSGSTLEDQRAPFVDLSKDLVHAVKSFKAGGGKELYLQFCPMANKDAGAWWLSDKKEVKNPYYGEAMLTCGSVVETIN